MKEARTFVLPLICETVIELVSYRSSISWIDSRVQAKGVEIPRKDAHLTTRCKLVLMLSADQARGAHSVKLELESGAKHDLGQPRPYIWNREGCNS